jgi:hypothetical protein
MGIPAHGTHVGSREDDDMNSADHAVLALGLDPQFQAGSIGSPGREPNATPRSSPSCGVLVAERRFTRPDPCFFGELKSRMVS